MSFTIAQLRQAQDSMQAAKLDGYPACDTAELLRQIGAANVLAISGGRYLAYETGVWFPVSSGYGVSVDLAPGDTYTVRRLWSRAGVTQVVGEMTGVYCDTVGEMAYQASCFRNVRFGAHAGTHA